MTDPEPTTKSCPACAEEVRAEARICRFCRHSFVEADAMAPATRRCPECAEDIAADAPACPLCGHEDSPAPAERIQRGPNLALRVGIPLLILVAMLVFLLVSPAPTYVPAEGTPIESGPSPTPCVTIDPAYADPDADFDTSATLDPNVTYCDWVDVHP